MSSPPSGATGAPGWMRGGTLPASMMGGSAGADPGAAMGALFANAPGPRVSAAQAQRLGAQAPAGASIDQGAHTITFTTVNVNLVVLASPAATSTCAPSPATPGKAWPAPSPSGNQPGSFAPAEPLAAACMWGAPRG